MKNVFILRLLFNELVETFESYFALSGDAIVHRSQSALVKMSFDYRFDLH